jgi:hypothetical protein
MQGEQGGDRSQLVKLDAMLGPGRIGDEVRRLHHDLHVVLVLPLRVAAHQPKVVADANLMHRKPAEESDRRHFAGL